MKEALNISRYITSKLFYCIIVFSYAGCSQRIVSESEFLKWINDPLHGLVKEKRINGFVFKVKYLPLEYLVYNELKGEESISSKEVDSLSRKYSSARTFLLTISPDESKGNKSDVMYFEVDGMEKFKKRVSEMNFSFDRFLSLQTDAGEYKPVLVNLENNYSMSNSRTIYIVFSDDKRDVVTANKIDFVYRDEIFNSGISHFVFDKKEIENIPKLNFWKSNI